MNKSNQHRLILVMALIFIVLFSVCLFALIKGADQHFLSSAKVSAFQVGNLIQSNENEKNELQESLKEDYIAKAKAFAYILENNPHLEERQQ